MKYVWGDINVRGIAIWGTVRRGNVLSGIARPGNCLLRNCPSGNCPDTFKLPETFKICKENCFIPYKHLLFHRKFYLWEHVEQLMLKRNIYKKEIIVTLKLELMNIWKKTKNLIYTNIYTIMKSVSQVLIQSVFPC